MASYHLNPQITKDCNSFTPPWFINKTKTLCGLRVIAKTGTTRAKYIKPITQLSKVSPAEASSAYHSRVHRPGSRSEWIKGKVPIAYASMDKGSPSVTPSLLYKNVDKPLNTSTDHPPVGIKKKAGTLRPKNTSMQQHGSTIQRIKSIGCINK